MSRNVGNYHCTLLKERRARLHRTNASLESNQLVFIIYYKEASKRAFELQIQTTASERAIRIIAPILPPICVNTKKAQFVTSKMVRLRIFHTLRILQTQTAILDTILLFQVTQIDSVATSRNETKQNLATQHPF